MIVAAEGRRAPWRGAGSLRFKVTAGVLLILIVAMGAVFVVQYRWFQQALVARLGLSSAPLSDVIKGSLTHAMQTRDLSEIRAIVANVSRQPGVVKVFVVDKQGVIRFSPVEPEIGTRLALDDPTCQVCHKVRPEARSHTVIYATPGGERVFRNVNPIVNEPACHGCHDARNTLNGVLISDFSMADLDRQLAGRRRDMLLGLLLAGGGTGLLITLIMNRLVISKLERFALATRRLGRGQLDLHVDVGAGGELGELATSFNQMIEGLRRAREVRERKELLENLLDSVADWVLVFGTDEVVLAMNRASEGVFGTRAADVVGRPFPVLGEEHRALLERARTRGPFSTELPVRGGEGRVFPARVHLAPLRGEQGALLACVVVGQDLTAQRAREQLHAQLMQSEKLAAVGRLAAGVAHELNNPLGHVLMYATLLLEDLPPDDARAANARHVVDNALRCKAIVRSLLESAKQAELRLAWVDLDELAGEAVGLVDAEARRRSVACRHVPASGLPRVRGDRQQLQQVLVNLLQNALEALDPGGEVTVSVGAERERGTVVVRVADDGPGVPAADRLRVFEPFYTTKPQGTGLGLAICHGIVERHGGVIWVEHPSDGAPRGSVFCVRLPVGGEAAA